MVTLVVRLPGSEAISNPVCEAARITAPCETFSPDQCCRNCCNQKLFTVGGPLFDAWANHVLHRAICSGATRIALISASDKASICNSESKTPEAAIHSLSPSRVLIQLRDSSQYTDFSPLISEPCPSLESPALLIGYPVLASTKSRLTEPHR